MAKNTLTPMQGPAASILKQTPKTQGWYNRELHKHPRSPHTHNKHSLMQTHEALGKFIVPQGKNHYYLLLLAICLPSGPLFKSRQTTKEAHKAREDEVRDLSLFFMIRFLLYQKRSMRPVDVFEVVRASDSEGWCHLPDLA